MRPRAPLSFVSAVAAGSIALAVGAFMGACAKQGEAERCSSKDDCSGDLECVSRPGVNSTICCPPGDGASTDECKGVLTPTTDAASSDVKETAPVTDTATAPDGGFGAACTYDSQCLEQFRCRLGKCQYECLGDRDCKLEFSDRPFCNACGDHQCHATSQPDFNPNEAGVCGADAGSDGGTDTATGETEADTSVEDTSVVDTAVEDTATPTDTADAGG
jgi:hypothetical protein